MLIPLESVVIAIQRKSIEAGMKASSQRNAFQRTRPDSRENMVLISLACDSGSGSVLAADYENHRVREERETNKHKLPFSM